jgi:serine/threonine protein kinase
MKLGLESWASQNAVDATIDSPGPSPGFVPPKPDELADRFPQYEILDLLGHGGMGAVYKARQRSLDRLVAIKIIKPDAADNAGFAERFHREAKALAKLNHANVVGVIDFDEMDGLFYVVMEYVDGTDLRRLIESKTLAPEQAIEIIPQICEALQFAHDEGIVHRDIKPENILVDSRGRVKIADFGLAKLLANGGPDYALTGTHQVMGTPRYMAPEQMEGARAVDHRADIYSLGVVFYEMLTGELPLGRFDPPSRKATINEEWDAVIMRTLEKEPDRRYQQASDIKLDVDKLSQLDHTAPRPVSSAQLVSAPASLTLDGEAMSSGVVRFDGSQVTLEFDVSEDDAAWFEGSTPGYGKPCKPGVHEVVIPLSEIGSAEFRSGWFSGELLIKTHSVRSVADVPGSDQATVTLAITKENAGAAQQLVNAIEHGLGREPKPVAEGDSADPRVDGSRLMAHPGTMCLGGVMLAIGFALLVASLTSGGGIASPFLWVGIGLSIGGGGCFSDAFSERSKLPVGTMPDAGAIILGLIMLAIGTALFVYSLKNSFVAGDPFLWIGIGLMMGGGGCLQGAWRGPDSDSPHDAEGVPPAKPLPGKPPLLDEVSEPPRITGNLVVAWVTLAAAHAAISSLSQHAANPVVSWILWSLFAVVTPTVLCSFVVWAGQRRRGFRYPVHPGEWLWHIHAIAIVPWFVFQIPVFITQVLEHNGVLNAGPVSYTVVSASFIVVSLLHAILAGVAVFVIREGRWRLYAVTLAVGMLARVAATAFHIASMWTSNGSTFAVVGAISLGFCVLPVVPLGIIAVADAAERKRYPWSHWVGVGLQASFHLLMLAYVIVLISQAREWQG